MDRTQALAIAHRYLEIVDNHHWKVLEAFLFGSQAKGTARPDSDVDVALVIDSPMNSVLVQWEMLKLRRSIDLMIEPHPFSPDDWAEGTPFTEEIKRTGIRLL